jgi:energy-coupling factor transporter transmembrane protein EcfT
MIFVSVSYLPFYVALILFLICIVFVLCAKIRRITATVVPLSSFALLLLTLIVCIFVSFGADSFIYDRGDSSSGNEFLFFTNDADVTVIDISKENYTSFSKMMARCEDEHISEISNYIITRYNDSLCEGLYNASAKIKMKKILLPEPTSYDEKAISDNVTRMLDGLSISYELYKRNEPLSLNGLQMTLIPTGTALRY